MATCEIWVLVDADGNYVVGNSADQARERFDEEISALEDADGFRLVKLVLSVALPAVKEIAGTVPMESGATLSL